VPGPCTVPSVPVAVGDPARAGDAARQAASPALRPRPSRGDRASSDLAGARNPDEQCSSAIPSHPDDYQILCPMARGGLAGKSLIYRGLVARSRNAVTRRCSGLLQKGWQEVANDCRA
jgi:hypothetical protein